ncbi:M3 family metallopeptidase [Sphingomonas sp. LHG3443-2]|uniref:M3 family metallopeptidase n=1 Tax=Sphingomonas sp. LHG3443-2 TaxID=2804639 RepID=UPI003CF05E74
MTKVRWAFAAGASLSVIMAATAGAQTLPPILTGAPTAAAVTTRCNELLTLSAGLRKQLEAPGQTATALQQFDKLLEVLIGASGEAGLYREVLVDDAARNAAQDCEVKVGTEFNAVSLSRPIYDKLKALPQPNDRSSAFFLQRTLQSFELSGVALDGDNRAEARKLADRISELSTTFQANIPKDRRTISVTPAELDGLPSDYLAAHKPGADGRITLSTDGPDYFPVMTYAKNAALRERYMRLYGQVGHPANDPVLRELIDTRLAFARLIGRPDYATVDFESRMLNTPAKVEALLSEMAAAARPASAGDYAKKLAVLRQIDPQATALRPWDNSYLTPIVQKQSYGFDRQEARRYFSYPKVRDGLLQLSEDLFGVEIKPWQTSLWHPKAEAYEMFEGGKLIGRFYLDMHPRAGKYEHANVVPVRQGIGRQVPVTALVMNAPDGLMEHEDVVTFLHEYGHLLHAIFGGQNQRWAGQSGIATESDFGEAPSQMLEEWVFDYDTLAKFATDEAGKPIPKALVDQMNRARYFDVGMQDMRQLGLSEVALRLYQGPAPADLGAAYRKLRNTYDPIPVADWSQGQASFTHLAGYGASYYTYRWSKVIADDLFTRFAKEGLRNKKTAADYRRLVLAPGGTKPAAELVQDFLGRPISTDAYKAEMAKAAR